jgi:DNA-binding PadR family transcriptional regulator
MKREQALIETLLAEIESMPIGNGGTVPAQYFFFKLNNISSELNPGHFAAIESALTAVRQHENLPFSQGKITYHLSLLLEEGLISAVLSETYDGTFIAVKSLTAKGHNYLDDRRKKEEGPLIKALNAFKANAPEWVARSLITDGLKWFLGFVGILATSQIPAVKQFLLSAWFGQHH